MDYTIGAAGLRINEDEQSARVISKNGDVWVEIGEPLNYPVARSGFLLSANHEPDPMWRIVLDMFRQQDVFIYREILETLSTPCAVRLVKG